MWVDIHSNNGLLPDGTKLLAKPMLLHHQWGSVAHNEFENTLEKLLHISQGPMNLNSHLPVK